MTALAAREQSGAESQQHSIGYGNEIEQFHTRLLRTSLIIEESRAYWEHLRLDIPKERRATVAFEERWFGSKSMPRVRLLLSELHHRYDAYPTALEVLMRWQPGDSLTRQNIGHWHLQLSDPTYRQFTGVFFEQRRSQGALVIDRDIVTRWLSQEFKLDWAMVTLQRMASSLLTAAAAAGLCSSGVGSRTIVYPKVSDEALGYWLYFLRHLSYAGSLVENPYLRSVGMSDLTLEQRVRQLPGFAFSRMSNLYDFGWQYPDLHSWASGVLGSGREAKE
jgi:hypothetical protein